MINLKTIVFIVCGGAAALTYCVMWVQFAIELDEGSMMPKSWLVLHCQLALCAIVWLFTR